LARSPSEAALMLTRAASSFIFLKKNQDGLRND
jgi:hypothetical protein